MAYGSSSNSGGSSRSSRSSRSSKARTVASRISKAPTKPLRIDNSNQIQTGFVPRSLNFNLAGANSEKIILNRDVFNKVAFNNTVDTNFSQLDQEAPDLSFFDPNLATIEDFFSIYQNLFFQIPKYGNRDSHEYLVVESTAYTGFIENQAQIDALLEEITDLREENLQLQLDIQQLLGAKETIDQAIRLNTDDGGASSLEDLINDEAAAGAAQSNSSSDLLGTTSDGSTLPSQGGMGGNSGGGGGGGIPGVTQGLTDAFEQQTGGDPLPPNPFGPGGGSNTNPGMPKY